MAHIIEFTILVADETMMPLKTAKVFQLRVDAKLKREFAEAAHREQTTPSKAMRKLMENFVRDNFRKEAERQSRIVATAPDHEETMDEIERLSAWMHEPDADRS